MLFDSRTGAPDQPWGVRLDHRFVVGEASRRQNDTRACSNCHFLAVLLGDDADHSISVDDQALDSHVVFCSYAEAFGRLDQWLHQHETTALLPGALAAHLWNVPARGRCRDRVERCRVLAAGIHESVVEGVFPSRVGRRNSP